MRPLRMVITAMLLTTSAFDLLGSGSSAWATTKEDVALNGTFRVTSMGNLAKINDQYNAEPVVVSKWTVSSSCANFQECTGTVISDQGWTAPMKVLDGAVWYVRRDVPNWEPCQDGTAFSGQQTYYFYPVDPAGSGTVTIGSPVLTGKDKTLGPSGACGQNTRLDITMPVRLDKVA